jgi:DNA-binding beta-propeller fold protein YncE
MRKEHDGVATGVTERIATVVLFTCSAGSSIAAQGDVLERFDPMDNWATELAFDFSGGDRVYLFHQSDSGLGVMSTAAPHELTVVATNKIGPQDFTGGSIDPATGRIYASDFDGAAISKNGGQPARRTFKAKAVAP